MQTRSRSRSASPDRRRRGLLSAGEDAILANVTEALAGGGKGGKKPLTADPRRANGPLKLISSLKNATKPASLSPPPSLDLDVVFSPVTEDSGAGAKAAARRRLQKEKRDRGLVDTSSTVDDGQSESSLVSPDPSATIPDGDGATGGSPDAYDAIASAALQAQAHFCLTENAVDPRAPVSPSLRLMKSEKIVSKIVAAIRRLSPDKVHAQVFRLMLCDMEPAVLQQLLTSDRSGAFASLMQGDDSSPAAEAMERSLLTIFGVRLLVSALDEIGLTGAYDPAAFRSAQLTSPITDSYAEEDANQDISACVSLLSAAAEQLKAIYNDRYAKLVGSVLQQLQDSWLHFNEQMTVASTSSATILEVIQALDWLIGLHVHYATVLEAEPSHPDDASPSNEGVSDGEAFDSAAQGAAESADRMEAANRQHATNLHAIRHMSHTLESSEAEIARLTTLVASLQDQLDAAASDGSNYAQCHAQLHEAKEQLEKAKEDYLASQEEVIATRSKMVDQHQQAEAVNAQLSDDNAALQTQVDNFRDEANTAVQAAHQATSAKEIMAQQVAALQDELSANQEQLAAAESELHESAARQDELRAELATASDALTAAQAEAASCAEATAEHQQALAQLDESNARQASLQASLAEANDALVQAQAEARTCEQAAAEHHQALQHNIGDLQRDHDALQSQLEQHQQQHTELARRAGEVSDQMEATASSLRETQQAHDKLAGMRDELQARMEQCQDDTQALQAQLAEARDEHAKLESKRAAIKAVADKLSASLKQAQSDAHASKEEVAAIQSQLQAADADHETAVDSLRKALEEAQSGAHASQGEVAALRSQLQAADADHETAVDSLRKALEEAQSGAHASQGDVAAVRSQLLAAEADHATSQAKIELMTQELVELRQQADELRQQHESSASLQASLGASADNLQQSLNDLTAERDRLLEELRNKQEGAAGLSAALSQSKEQLRALQADDDATKASLQQAQEKVDALVRSIDDKQKQKEDQDQMVAKLNATLKDAIHRLKDVTQRAKDADERLAQAASQQQEAAERAAAAESSLRSQQEALDSCRMQVTDCAAHHHAALAESAACQSTSATTSERLKEVLLGLQNLVLGDTPISRDSIQRLLGNTSSLHEAASADVVEGNAGGSQPESGASEAEAGLLSPSPETLPADVGDVEPATEPDSQSVAASQQPELGSPSVAEPQSEADSHPDFSSIASPTEDDSGLRAPCDIKQQHLWDPETVETLQHLVRVDLDAEGRDAYREELRRADGSSPGASDLLVGVELRTAEKVYLNFLSAYTAAAFDVDLQQFFEEVRAAGSNGSSDDIARRKADFALLAESTLPFHPEDTEGTLMPPHPALLRFWAGVAQVHADLLSNFDDSNLDDLVRWASRHLGQPDDISFILTMVFAWPVDLVTYMYALYSASPDMATFTKQVDRLLVQLLVQATPRRQ